MSIITNRNIDELIIQINNDISVFTDGHDTYLKAAINHILHLLLENQDRKCDILGVLFRIVDAKISHKADPVIWSVIVQRALQAIDQVAKLFDMSEQDLELTRVACAI